MFIENLTKKDVVKFYKQNKVPVLDIYPFDRDLQQTYGYGYCVINCKKKLGQNVNKYDLMVNGNMSYVTEYNLYFNSIMANSEYAHIQNKWTNYMFECLAKNRGFDYATEYQNSLIEYNKQVKENALRAKYAAAQEQEN